ncbi:MAG: 50S ribosomal protein L21 [Chloroflexi bacterium]|nr:50S ribosomal protein L21 [Chloroflexota bacterium]
MYAVIETGGKQYRVEVGTELEVELLDAEPGKTITIDRVLLVADGDESSIGRPLVPDASVSAEVVAQTRGPKLISFKYRPKARSRVKKGHRQDLTLLRIADITLGGKSAAKTARKAQDEASTERQRAADAAAAQAAKDAELAAKLALGADDTPKKSTKSTSTGKSATKAKGGDAATAATADAPASKAPAAKPKANAKTKPASKAPAAKPKANAKTKTSAKSTTTKRTTAKAAANSDADASETKADAPKRTRATKKDE